MEVLTAEKFDELVRKNLGHLGGAPHLFDDLKPYLKECLRCEGRKIVWDSGYSPSDKLDLVWCPDCKPERRLMQRRDRPDRRRYDIIDRRKT